MIFKLPKLQRKAKRRGRGHGSGVGGHTVGFGQNGQGVRGKGKVSIYNEGGNVPMHRKIPKYGGFKALTPKHRVVQLSWLIQNVEGGSEVTEKMLVSMGVKLEPNQKPKVVGNDKIDKKLTLKGIAASKGVVKSIEEAGGKVV